MKCITTLQIVCKAFWIYLFPASLWNGNGHPQRAGPGRLWWPKWIRFQDWWRNRCKRGVVTFWVRGKVVCGGIPSSTPMGGKNHSPCTNVRNFIYLKDLYPIFPMLEQVPKAGDGQSNCLGPSLLVISIAFNCLTVCLSSPVQVPVPRHSVGVVIGRSGEMIKKIQNDAGVRIQFKQGQKPHSFRVMSDL